MESSTVIDDLVELVRIPTVSGEEDAAERFFENWFAERGWQLDRQALAATAAAQTPRGRAEPRPSQRHNLFGWLGTPTGRPIVTLNAHYDVVPVIDPDDWTTAPFGADRRDGAIYGRGAVDNKAGVIAALYALQLVHERGVELPFDLMVELIVAEETTGLGTVAALERFPSRRAAVVLEPTGCDVVAANSGALFFTIRIEGRASHTSVPWRGEDALRRLITVYGALRQLGERRDLECRHPLMEHLPSAVPTVIGTLSGGGWRAAVPAHAAMSGRIGVLPGESLEKVRAELEAVLGAVSASDPWLTDHPPQLTWDNDGLPGWELDSRAPLVRAMVAGQEAAGLPERVVGLSAGCDAGTLRRAGIPTVVFGPGDMAVAHSADEHVSEAEVLRAIEILASGMIALGADGNLA
ncbi:M20 family metallopeptidase [Lysinimonas soli]|uniref:M20 family metallopeptidase n=1 Tax=Lysinimonas soli TaxID=1074233 RepID=A0ABW0NRB5_9MICO